LNEKLHSEGEWYFISDAMAILSPVAAKKLQAFLERAIKTYESEHGTIQTEFKTERTY
jgi:hypothetical protein